MRVATVILRSNGKYSNDKREKVLSDIVHAISRETDRDGLVLFPGGWYSAGEREANTLYTPVGSDVREVLRKTERNIVVCLGIDGRVTEYAKDQIGVAISKNGIEAIGRKFHRTREEEKYVKPAENYSSKEEGYSRIFSLGETRFFLCACYDSFGIRKKNLSNPGVDVILDLVHGFDPKGEGNSGDVYFAKYGFAGASKQWNCPIFGAAVFFNRKIPDRWPSGVYWNQGNKSPKNWKYEYNPIKVAKSFDYDFPEGKALIRIYNLNEVIIENLKKRKSCR